MHDIEKIIIRFDVEENLSINQNLGSVMQGLLMEQINKAYSQYLHSKNLRPYSQFIMFDKDNQELIWNITALNHEAIREIITPLRQLPDKCWLKNKGKHIYPKAVETLAAFTYEEFVAKHMINSEENNRITFNFLTTTTFKSNGSYILYPEIYYIFNNLLKRWNTFALDNTLNQYTDLNTLLEYLNIVNYKLNYRKFSVERVNLPGFVGSLTLQHNAPEPISNILYLLADYANYAGIGIKTAIGMGGALVYSK